MKIVIFCHSLSSDWNHGNAHFLRGVISELLARKHQVKVYEPSNSWSRANLISDQGQGAIDDYQAAYQNLTSESYETKDLDLDAALSGADLVLVHEWNDHDLVASMGKHRRKTGQYRLLFHDTHHRSVSQPEAMASYDLRNYDGVLAFGEVIRNRYLQEGWTRRAWTWHEAADPRVFQPRLSEKKEGDLVWIGNWGDDERTAELREFLLKPVKELGLKAKVYGVRYPREAREELAKAGIEYGGYLPNFQAPDVFGRYRVTVHVPRRPYAESLPGIPTIRMFEALACGMPLVSAPWRDVERLFEAGKDYLVARNGSEMKSHLTRLLADPTFAYRIGESGRARVRRSHTCAHRVDQLIAIYDQICEEEALAVR
jgi:spore maturation protein CgeB